MKNIKIITLLLLFATITITSCSSLKMAVRPGVSFSKNSSITIVAQEDVAGTVGELTHLLLQKGFNVISYSTAKKAIKYKSKDKGNEFEAERYKVQDLNSIYALELDCNLGMGEFTDYVYDSFSARVTNLNTGEIVASASFRGHKSVDKVLKEFANKLAKNIE